MRTRPVATALAGGVLTATANRVLADRTGPLDSPLPGHERTYRWRGFDVSYTTAGDPDTQDVLFLHGIHAAGSSVEFRGIFEAIASRYHVIAPDLPGFGRSDRPAIIYDASLYEGFIRDFVAHVTDSPIVVASSLTGAFAANVAASSPIEELILVCPTDETGRQNAFVRELIRSPLVGEGLFNLLVSKPSLRNFNRDLAYHDPAAVPADLVDYQWQTAHQPNARYAPASFVGGFLDPSTPLSESLEQFDGPVTLIWGREATRPRLASGRTLAEAVNARLVVIDKAALLPHAEHPNEFVDAIVASLPRLERQ